VPPYRLIINFYDKMVIFMILLTGKGGDPVMNGETRGTKDFYNDIAREFSDTWYENESMLPVLQEFVSLLEEHPRVLDLGCGAGYESMRLKRLGAEVVGIDYSEEPIKIARDRNPDCIFHLMDFKNMDASIGTFDGIAAIASLIHIGESDLDLVFGNIRKVLKPGGYVLLAVVEGDGVSAERSRIERNGIRYDRTFYLHKKARLDTAAKNTGFEFFKELTMPEESAAYGWKCFIFRG
jgi:SAM-dependent methyltransferase